MLKKLERKGWNIIENSLNEAVSERDLKSIENITFSAHHMRENIIKLEFCQHSSRQLKETCASSILLWENPRAYIFRHLGKKEWGQKTMGFT